MIDHLIVDGVTYTQRYRGNKRAITNAKKYVRRVKNASRCIKDGESRPWCLDFHHREQENKFMSIYNMAKRGFPIEVIKIELNKCDCICANDHREIHNKRFWIKI